MRAKGDFYAHASSPTCFSVSFRGCGPFPEDGKIGPETHVHTPVILVTVFVCGNYIKSTVDTTHTVYEESTLLYLAQHGLGTP